MILFENHPKFFRSILHIQGPWTFFENINIKKILRPQYLC